MQAQNVQSSGLVAGKWFVAFVVSLWASIPTAVQVLLVLMVIDYATGIMRGFVEKSLSSSTGLRGLVKKTATILLVVTAHFLVKALNLPFDVGTTLASAFIMNEVISIVENSADIGVPIPPALLDVLLRAKKMTGRGQGAAEVKQELDGPDQPSAVSGTGSIGQRIS